MLEDISPYLRNCLTKQNMLFLVIIVSYSGSVVGKPTCFMKKLFYKHCSQHGKIKYSICFEYCEAK